MEVEICFTTGRITPPCRKTPPSIGAVAEFYGLVRGKENEKPISALLYEIYEPMARKVLGDILETLNAAHPVVFAAVIHRHGVVPVGEASIYVRIESVYRAEAFHVMREFMDRLKADVPIWKTGSQTC